jgi:glycosyltransferase involved in cell wall biosynthesis
MSDPDSPLVSVIMPVYNGRRYVAEALESVFAQRYRPLECIVVDDGSIDGSVEIIEQYPVKYIRQAQCGPGAARNAGVRASRGQLVAFLDQDDQWDPDKLTAQVQTLLAERDAGYVVSLQETRLDSGIEKPDWISDEQLRRDDGFMPGMLLVSRETFDQVGPFREDFSTSSDAEWFFRAQDLGIRHARVMKRLLIRRVHRENQSRDVDSIHRELLKIARESIRRRRPGGDASC